MKTILDISGMHSANCASTINEHLQAVSGVQEATTNFSTRTAIVTHASSLTTKQLLTAVREAGYTAQLRQQREAQGAVSLPPATFPYVVTLSAAILGLLVLTEWLGVALAQPVSVALQALLATIILVAARSVFYNGFVVAAKDKQLNADTLIALAAGVAFVYSLFTLAAWVVSGSLFVEQLYFSTAGLVLALFVIARYAQAQLQARAQEVLASAHAQLPVDARLVIDGTEKTIPLNEVAPGDTLKVKPGEVIPVDGVILAGNTRVDESVLTGEPAPLKKGIRDRVRAGALNKTGMFLVTVQAVGSETVLARLTAQVQEAQVTQAPLQETANRISLLLVPGVIVLSVLTFVGWLAFTPAGVAVPVAYALSAAIAVLVVASPSALALATPTAVQVGVGAAGARGVVFCDAAALQQAAGVRMVAFDKTGTLTEGSLRVQYIKTYNNLSEHVVFRYAASVESQSEHPVAQAFQLFADEHNISYGVPRSFSEVPGRGVRGKVEGRKIVVGSLQFFLDEDIGIYDARERIQELAKKQLSPVLVAIEGKLAAIVGVEDSLKESSEDGVLSLTEMGVDTALLSGDRAEVSQVVASQLGVGVVRAQLGTDEKLAELRRLKRKRSVAFVGSSFTPTELFAEADVGVLLSGREDSLGVADVFLVGEAVTGVSRVLHVARRSVRAMRQNFAGVFGYHLVALPVAAGALYPFIGLLSPIFAAGLMAAVSLSVVLNSLRLKSTLWR